MGALARRERVLIVDDEPQLLIALEDALGEAFEVVVTNRPERALELAEGDPELAVVVSDQSMPGMTGAELFRRLRQISSASRVLITGLTDLEAVARAVNDGNICAFVTKPWTTADLRLKIRLAAEQFRLARELHISEERLRLAQKLEGIGQLAAGIAHEINTPTQYVTDNVTFLQRAFVKLCAVLEAHRAVADSARQHGVAGDELSALDAALKAAKVEYLLEQAPRALEQSLAGLTHVSSIVKAMKELSHPSGAEKKLADLHAIIESATVVSKNEWKYVAEMQLDFDQALPPISVLRNELSQVILNLIVNAAHAIADAQQASAAGGLGKITISTHKLDDAAEIRVADTGAGIPEAIRSRVFEPFFTTKAVGKGTGQGLSICYSVIVDKHAGSIAFDSEPGRGTTFVIRLPAA